MTIEVQQELHKEIRRRQKHHHNTRPRQQPERRKRQPIHAVDACRVATRVFKELDNEN